MSNFIFKRPELACNFCDSLQGKGIEDARSGLFLSAPRRAGKSTFLQNELTDEALRRDWLTVYVDLWSNKLANPLDLISEAIKNKILHFHKMHKLTKKINLEKINLGAFTVSFAQPGLPENMTLTDALHLLHSLSRKPILLMIDEAQHAIASQNGLNTMFAIKSARDQLNHTGNPILFLVFTGSNRNKLSHLVYKKDQPFFGSQISSFPLLHEAYTQAFTIWVNKNLKTTNQFTQKSMWHAFQLVGHKPEILRQLVAHVAISGDAKQLGTLLEKDAEVWQNHFWNEFRNDYDALTPLQKIMIAVLIEKNIHWSPFSEESMTTYQEHLQQKNLLSTGTVQTALHSLCERGLIWQSGRGTYALEDDGFAAWFKIFYQL